MAFVRRVFAVVAWTFLSDAAVLAQPKPLPPPSFGSFSNPYGRSLQWLAHPQVQDELELTGEQRDALRGAQDEMTRKVRELYRSPEVNQKDFRQRQQAYREKLEALSDEAERRAEAILTGPQAVRLKQIIRQTQLGWRSDGILAVLLDQEISTALRLTDHQREALREEQGKIQRERARKVQEFYRQLQTAARERMFAVLTADQRRQLDKLLGPAFELQPPVGGLPGPPTSREPSQER